jgi:hypothetical protein
MLKTEAVRKYDAAKFTDYLCRTLCRASKDVLLAAGEEYYWLWSLDDRLDNFDTDLKSGSKRKTVISQNLTILNGQDPREDYDESAKFLHHILKQTEDCAKIISADNYKYLMHRWKQHVANYLLLGCLAPKEDPNPLELIRQKMHSSAIYTLLCYIQLSQGLILTPELAEHPDINRLETLVNLMAWLLNDILSFQKEVLINNDPSDNCVGVLMKSKGLSFANASKLTAKMIVGYKDEFWSIAKMIINDIDSIASNEKEKQQVQLYIQGLWEWICGAYDWGITSSRYCRPDSPFPELRQPTSKL